MRTLLARLQSVFARAMFWRRPAAAASAEHAAEDAAPAEPLMETAADTQRDLPAPPGGDAPAGAPPRRALGKRILRVAMRKTVWMPAAALLLLTLGAVASAVLMHAREASERDALRALQAAKLQLEQENRQLRARPAIIPAPAAQPAAPSPAPDGDGKPGVELAAQAASSPAKPSARTAGADCVVTEKEKVGESLRRCIEAFNQATSRRGKP